MPSASEPVKNKNYGHKSKAKKPAAKKPVAKKKKKIVIAQYCFS